MEVSAWIKLFCGKIWVANNLGCLINKTGTERVVGFGDRLWEIIVYPKFVHMLSALI